MFSKFMIGEKMSLGLGRSLVVEYRLGLYEAFDLMLVLTLLILLN